MPILSYGIVHPTSEQPANQRTKAQRRWSNSSSMPRRSPPAGRQWRSIRGIGTPRSSPPWPTSIATGRLRGGATLMERVARETDAADAGLPPGRRRQALLRLVQDLDCGDEGVILDGLEGQIDLSLGRWLDVRKRFLQRVKASGFLEDVQVLSQHDTVGHHVEQPASDPALSG